MIVQRWMTFGGRELYDPGYLRQENERHGATLEFWKKANSFYCPRGMEPGVGYLLMRRRDLTALSTVTQYSLVQNELQRTLGSGANGGGQTVATTFKNLLITDARCMNPALAGDPDSLYLVTVRDKRHLLQKSFANIAYNVRMPGPPQLESGGAPVATLYYTESLNSGAIWSWVGLCQSLWSMLPAAQAGAWPGLPYTPHSVPEGFRFFGVSAWSALGVVLAKLQCSLVYNPTTDVFSIVALGATQPGLAQFGTINAKYLNYEYDPAVIDAALIPEKLKICFHKQPQHYGSQDDTPRESNWVADPVHVKEVATAVVGAVAGTAEAVWDDLAAIVAPDGTLVNETALDTRAAEVANKWKQAWLYNAAPKNQRYTGFRPIAPGSEVSAVLWRNYGNNEGDITEVMRETDALPLSGAGSPAGERLLPPDLSRGTFPVYPHVMQWVKLVKGSEADLAEANDDGFYTAVYQRGAPGTSDIAWADLDNCFVVFADESSKPRPTDIRYIARIQGTITTVTVDEIEETRPLLIASPCDSSCEIARAIVYGADASIFPGGTGEAKRRNSTDDGWEDDPVEILNTTSKTLKEDDEIVIGKDELGVWVVLEAPGNEAVLSKATVYGATIDFDGEGEVLEWDCDEEDYATEPTSVTNRTRPLFKGEAITIGKDKCGNWLAINTDAHTIQGVAAEDIGNGDSGTVVLDEYADTPEIEAVSALGEVKSGDTVYVIWFNGLWRIIAAECSEE